MKVKTAKTTVDFTGAQIVNMIKEKITEELGNAAKIAKIDITYAYEKKEDGKCYRKTDLIKRVRVTL